VLHNMQTEKDLLDFYMQSSGAKIWNRSNYGIRNFKVKWPKENHPSTIFYHRIMIEYKPVHQESHLSLNHCMASHMVHGNPCFSEFA